MIATRSGTSWLLLELPEPERLVDPATAPGVLGWLRLARDGNVETGETPMTELAGLVQPGERLLALVPGERAPLHRVAVPGKSARVRRRALPYALEERLSEDLEALRIVPGPAHGREMTAAVAARSDVQQWETFLQTQGLNHARLIPDIALLRGFATPDRHQVLVGEKRCLLIPADAEPLALAKPLADWWLRARELPGIEDGHGGFTVATDALDEASDPRSPLPEALTPPAGWSGNLPDLLPAALQSGHPVVKRLQEALAFELGSRRDETGGASILPKREWRLPATLTLLLGLVWLGGQWLQIHSLERELAATEEAMVAVFEEALPDRRMVDPVGQFEIMLRDTGTAGDANAAASPLGESMALLAEQLDDDALTLRHLRGDAGRIELELDGPDVATVERLRENLEQASERRVRITSAESGDDRVRARLTLEGNP